MWRIDSPGAAPGNLFTEGDPQTATPATVVSAKWANAVQEEIAKAVENSGQTLQDGNWEQLTQAIRNLSGGAASSPSGIGSNLLINGDMRFLQRATSAPGGVLTKALGVAITGYALDRWQSSSDGGGGAGNATVSRQAFTQGQTAVPGFPTYHARHLQTIAPTVSAPFFRQKVEGVDQVGGTVTLSAWLKAAAAAAVTMRIVQNFGSGGSADVIAATQVVNLSTSWARQTLSIALPTVAGKTFGAGHHLLCEFLFPTGATYTIDLADIQLELSPSATGFQRRSPSVELSLCRRYFEKSWAPDTFAAATTCPLTFDGVSADMLEGGAASLVSLVRRFYSVKRGAPTMVWFNPATGDDNEVAVIGSSGVAVSGTTGATENATGYPTVATWAPDKTGAAHWTADAEL